MKLLNKTRNTLLAEEVQIADSFFSRLTGLLNRQKLAPSEALLIPHCQCIHMFFMRFSIDVLFVDKDNRIVGIVRRIHPFEISPVFLKSSFVVELMAGAIAVSGTEIGDEIECLE